MSSNEALHTLVRRALRWVRAVTLKALSPKVQSLVWGTASMPVSEERMLGEGGRISTGGHRHGGTCR